MTKEQIEARGLVLAEMVNQEATIASLRARVAELEAALGGLVNRLDADQPCFTELDQARAAIAKESRG